MKNLLILLTCLPLFSFGQFTKENIEKNSIELYNDIFNSSDFSSEIAHFNKLKNDTPFNVLVSNIKPDSFFSDTIRTTKYRISTEYGGSGFDTFYLVDEPYFREREIQDTLNFSRIDLSSFPTQIKLAKRIRWNSQIRNDKIIKQGYLNKIFRDGIDEGWNRYYRKYNEGYNQLSVPLFNQQFDTAVISVHNACGGLCAHGNTYLCKKIDGKWKIVETWVTWVS